MLQSHNLQSFLDRLTSRSRLSETEREAILKLPTSVSLVEARRDFGHPDHTVEHVNVVAEGVVARFGQTAQGERQITALHIAGDAPNLHSVVVPDDTFPLHALTATTVLRIPHAALRALAARNPAIAEAFWRHSSIGTLITAQWLVNVGRRSAKTRIAHFSVRWRFATRRTLATGRSVFLFRSPKLTLGTPLG